MTDSTPATEQSVKQTSSTIWTLDAIRDSIAEVLEHSNPNRPDYATDVELEDLERWQEGIAAAEARNEELVEAAQALLDEYVPGWQTSQQLGVGPALRARAALSGQPSPLREANEWLKREQTHLLKRLRDECAQSEELVEKNERLADEVERVREYQRERDELMKGQDQENQQLKAQRDELLEAIRPLLDQSGRTKLSLEQIAKVLTTHGSEPFWPGAAEVLREYSTLLASATKGGAE